MENRDRDEFAEQIARHARREGDDIAPGLVSAAGAAWAAGR